MSYAHEIPQPKPALESRTLQGAALAAAPVVLRVLRNRRASLTDLLALGGAGLTIYGRVKARGPLRF